MISRVQHSYLAVSVARNGPSACRAVIARGMASLTTLAVPQRDAVYRLLHLASGRELTSLFSEVLPVMLQDRHPAVQRRICNVMESFAYFIESEAEFNSCLQRALQVAASGPMVARVHACLAIRSLVEFHRIPIDKQMRNVSGPLANILIDLTLKLSGSAFLISLTPVFSLLLGWIPDVMLHSVVEAVRTLWIANARNEVVLMCLRELLDALAVRAPEVRQWHAMNG